VAERLPVVGPGSWSMSEVEGLLRRCSCRSDDGWLGGDAEAHEDAVDVGPGGDGALDAEAAGTSRALVDVDLEDPAQELVMGDEGGAPRGLDVGRGVLLREHALPRRDRAHSLPAVTRRTRVKDPFQGPVSRLLALRRAAIRSRRAAPPRAGAGRRPPRCRHGPPPPCPGPHRGGVSPTRTPPSVTCTSTTCWNRLTRE
jgi:hypothetical protein